MTRSRATSQTAFILVEKPAATRTIFWKRSSGEPLSPEELPRDFLEGADFLLLDGLMKDVSFFAARQAKEAGIPVVLDAGRVREGTLELARLSDYVVGSEEFARELSWKDDAVQFKPKIKKHGFGITTITLGSRGSVTYADDKVIIIPAFPVETVDTTGAGDVFHGGSSTGCPQMEPPSYCSVCVGRRCNEVQESGGTSGNSKAGGSTTVS